VLSVALRRTAWRAWVFLLVAWVLNAGAIVYSRVGAYGPGISLDPRYNAELAFLLPLATALAFTGGSVRESAVRALGRLRDRGRRLAWPLVVAGITLLAVSSMSSFERIRDSWSGARSRVWADDVRASAAALRSRGLAPSVLDGVAPWDVAATMWPPFNQYVTILPLIDSSLHVGAGGSAPTIVGTDGAMRLADFAALWGGPVTMLARSRRLTPGDGLEWRSKALCARAGRKARLLVRVNGFAPDLDVWLGVGVVPTETRRTIPVFLDRSSGFQAVPDLMLPVPAAGRLTGGFVSPGVYRRVLLDVPPRACVRSLVLVAVR